MTSTTLETSQRYTDGKRYWWLLGLVVPTLPLGGYFMVQATGLGVFWYWPLLFVYGVLPVLDWLIGTDENNPPESAVPDLENDAPRRASMTRDVRAALVAALSRTENDSFDVPSAKRARIVRE